MRSLADPGLGRLRGAAVTMVATLLSFGAVLWLKHAEGLTTSSVLLAVVLSLTLGRTEAAHRPHRVMRVIGPLLLPLLAVGAGEVGTRMFTHPNVGDAMFVVGMAGAIWVRRFGDAGRRAGTLLTLSLTAMLIAPGPVVPVGPHAPSRWWGAVVALIALCCVRATHVVAGRLGILHRERPQRVALPPRAAATARVGLRRRLPASTKMALQMAVALAAAFAAGRAAYGYHWTWTVLTAFIVGSGNRGRGDVAAKAVLRVVGAAGGTLAATALANAFPVGDDWSVVAIFAILSVAVWLRPLSYAYWASGVTAALALLYGFYGERGTHLLLDRLEGILLGAAIGVAAAWLVLPIRNVDVVRRYLSVALGAIASRVAPEHAAVVFPPETAALIQQAAGTAEAAAGSLRWLRFLPARWREPLPYADATAHLARCAEALPRSHDDQMAITGADRRRLAADVTAARRALAAGASVDQVAGLGIVTGRIAAALGS